MQVLTMLLSIMLVALTTPMVHAGLFVADELPPGYTWGTMGFHGEIDGHEITYDGTIEEVLAHAETLYPGITKSLAARDDVPLLDTFALASPGVVARDTQLIIGSPADGKGMRYCGGKKTPNESTPACPLCDKWDYCQTRRIQEGINYLNKVTAACTASAHQCVRISCSWHAGITLCNDQEDRLSAPCNWISTFAQDIVNDTENCESPTPHLTWPHVKGQQWAGNKAYNVVVAWSNC
ncbi:hypothetical protein ONS95_000528 [Cadophora gregata]|uniref:uncharacterized protein n=1 Tax=Cadophora gregata TaxID=51156 RepID=UPI0026DBDA87|nr:uncharacterized protein ONS95_000528 [Cadophora gregata]KAK0125459.1 hypothetical protein ONS96_009300 [Cadophora gregata f. sp. sojae]KAK0128564.1 hypothetical protein ONS95_000528 [Cadophora gregata]